LPGYSDEQAKTHLFWSNEAFHASRCQRSRQAVDCAPEDRTTIRLQVRPGAIGRIRILRRSAATTGRAC